MLVGSCSSSYLWLPLQKNSWYKRDCQSHLKNHRSNRKQGDNINQLIDSDLFFTTTDDELEIIVDDKDLDNDQEFVTSYGLDYDQVNYIELI